MIITSCIYSALFYREAEKMIVCVQFMCSALKKKMKYLDEQKDRVYKAIIYFSLSLMKGGDRYGWRVIAKINRAGKKS